MEAFQIYHVVTGKYKSGKAKEAVKCFQEKGKAFWESVPGVKSLNAYAGQFSLGGCD